ncbi:hypothetical protein DFH06DRAFT_1179446 [Mycena polygramma]|nr:hypothetical protein DFH06DRAFT_1179446 [Mycena polygramma]
MRNFNKQMQLLWMGCWTILSTSAILLQSMSAWTIVIKLVKSPSCHICFSAILLQTWSMVIFLLGSRPWTNCFTGHSTGTVGGD